MLNTVKKILRSCFNTLKSLTVTPTSRLIIRPLYGNIKLALKDLGVFLNSYPRYFLLLILTAITPFLLALLVFFVLTASKPTITVPQLEGLSLIDAATLIQDKNLYINLIPEDSDEYPQNFIIRQDITAGRTIKSDRTIVLYVSNGANTTMFPSIIGQNIYRVLSHLQHQSDLTKTIQIRYISWQNSQKPFGEILFQSPSAGEYRDFPIITDVVVSNGSHNKIPNFVGQYSLVAFNKATALGLTPHLIFEETNNPELQGKVIRQNPDNSNNISPDLQIQLVIGKTKDTENIHYFEYKVDDNVINKTIALTINDSRGKRILYLGTAFPGDIITASTITYGTWKAGIYIYEGEKKTLYKDLTL